jgi:hypothetical protein
LIDHILEHLNLADAYQANSARVAALKSGSKRSRDLSRLCSEAAERERAEAAAHSSAFDITDLGVTQELATWRRLRQYSLDRVQALTLDDVRWLRAEVRHGRSGSRNVRRAAELLILADSLLNHWHEDGLRPSSAETSEALGHCAANAHRDGAEEP